MSRTKLMGAGAGLIAVAFVLGSVISGLAGFDREVFDALAMRRGVTPGWEIAVAQDVTMIGNFFPRLIVFAAGIAVFAWRGLRDRMIALIAATVLGTVATEIAKALFARPRPTVYPYIGEFANYSYPSGHASDTIAMVLALGLLSRNQLFTMVCVAIALAVGMTRVMLDVHWPTDVIGGWVLGTGAALVGVALRRDEISRQPR